MLYEVITIQEWISDFRFMLAYDDILDFVLYPTEAENWLLHLKTGLEITMLETFVGWGVREFDLLHLVPFGSAWQPENSAQQRLYYDVV